MFGVAFSCFYLSFPLARILAISLSMLYHYQRYFCRCVCRCCWCSLYMHMRDRHTHTVLLFSLSLTHTHMDSHIRLLPDLNPPWPKWRERKTWQVQASDTQCCFHDLARPIQIYDLTQAHAGNDSRITHFHQRHHPQTAVLRYVGS